MLCCSDYCPKYKECALACINVEYKNRLDQVENLYTYGSCSIQYVDGEVKMKENYMCGPTSKYAMFVPIIPEYDKVFKKIEVAYGDKEKRIKFRVIQNNFNSINNIASLCS